MITWLPDNNHFAMHCSQPIIGFEIQICGLMAITVHGMWAALVSHDTASGLDYACFAQYAPYIGGERGSSNDTWVSQTILVK